MSVKVIAIKAEVAKAFYEENESFFLLEPLFKKVLPYSQDEMRLIIERDDYEKIDKSFANTHALIDFVKKEYEEIRKTEGGLIIPDSELLKRVVKDTSETLLLEYIQKAIEVWIPSGNIKGAKKLHSYLIEIPNLELKDNLLHWVKKLDEDITEAEKFNFKIKGRINVININKYKRKFPKLAEKHNDFEVYKPMFERREKNSPVMCG